MKELTTTLYARISDQVYPLEFGLEFPTPAQNSQWSSRWWFSLQEKSSAREAFGMTPWQALTIGLRHLYWEIETIERSQRATFHWTSADARAMQHALSLESIFGGLNGSQFR